MTLHWWMHWFWVTFKIAVILGTPIPSTTEQPRIEQDSSIIWGSITVRMTSSPERLNTVVPTKASMRIPKAINTYQPPMKENGYADPPMFRPSANASKIIKSPIVNSGYDSRTVNSRKFDPVSRTTNFWSGSPEVQREEADDNYRTLAQLYQKGTITFTWPATRRRNEQQQKQQQEVDEKFQNLSAVDENDLRVQSLKTEETKTMVIAYNRTQITDDINIGGSFSTGTFNSSEDIEIDQEIAEPRVSSATAVPVLHADFVESTRLNRARNAFAGDFHMDRAQDRSAQDDDEVHIIHENKIVESMSAESMRPTALEIAAITGSCLAMVVFLSAIGSFGFVMYRRKYCNPPQTLNSDKCSNPDSSGYIDDSTIRDNSEEMYSLDNDSFLNSLEAMTIQNYWTDSVKHTKL